MLKVVFQIMLVLIVGIYLRNASWLADPSEEATKIISHRGVHQTFSREGLTNETCTAERIFTPTHEYLENTIDSMQAAFEFGADIVELDIHPTTDGFHAVFHDWTVDCRTEGEGKTRDHDLASLKSLDMGYGYTSDGGKTYPLRGKGVGMMPSFSDVMAAFPNREFLVNFKSNDTASGQAFASALAQNPEWKDRIWAVYGGSRTNEAFRVRFPDIKAFDRQTTKSCLISYFKKGWSGRVPAVCHDTVIMVPISHRGLMWGWPHAFTARMESAGTEVVLIGPYTKGDPGTTGIDTKELWDKVPENFDGYIWTNRIETVNAQLK